MLLCSWKIFIEKHKNSIRFPTNCLMAYHYVGAIAYIISAPPMAMIAIFDICSQDVIHGYAAYAFFFTALVGLICNTISTHVTARRYTGSETISKFLHKTKIMKSVVVIICAIAVICYLPVGLTYINTNCGWKRINQNECLAKKLGQEYCTTAPVAVPDTESYQNSTCLFDYTYCGGANNLRSTMQHLSLLSMFAAMGIYGYDMRMLYKLTPPTVTSEKVSPRPLEIVSAPKKTDKIYAEL